MMTRVFLVGMVAALGITVPTWPDVQGWVNAAHSWTAHQLANWDACPRRTGYDVTVLPFAMATQRFEPIVASDCALDPAEELNRFAEVVDVAPAPVVVRRDPQAEGTARKSGRAVSREFAASGGVVTPEIACMAEWLLAVERPTSEVRATEAPLAMWRSRAIIARFECAFSPSLEARSRPLAIAPRINPIDPVADTRPDVADGLNRFGERFEIAPPLPTAATAPTPRFEPIDPGTALDTGLAFELNLASDGMALAWHAADAPHQVTTSACDMIAPGSADRPSPPTDVAHAIRLTGEAVQAWMKIMTGPALVQVSVR
jgi:hypothetical protein